MVSKQKKKKNNSSNNNSREIMILVYDKPRIKVEILITILIIIAVDKMYHIILINNHGCYLPDVSMLVTKTIKFSG